MARLYEKYQNELAGEIQKKLGLENPMQIPKITKITRNMGVGEAVADKKIMEKARGDMEKIAGQKPVTTLSRKSVAGFKIRDGMVDIQRFDEAWGFAKCLENDDTVTVALAAFSMVAVALLSLIPGVRSVKRLDIGAVVRERAV